MNLDERSLRFNALVQLKMLEAQLRIDNMIMERIARANTIRVSASGVATLPPDWYPNATPYWHQAHNRRALRYMGDHICNPVFSGLAEE